MTFTLYHHGSSVCAAKVRFAMAEKGMEWEGVYIDILAGEQFTPEYQKINTKSVVPTLVHDDLVDSLAYIDQLAQVAYHYDLIDLEEDYEPLDIIAGY